MDQIKTACGGCGRPLRMLTKHAGRKVKCPCGAILEVPILAVVQRALPERYPCPPVTVGDLLVGHPTTDSVSRRIKAQSFDDSLIIRRLADFDEDAAAKKPDESDDDE